MLKLLLLFGSLAVLWVIIRRGADWWCTSQQEYHTKSTSLHLKVSMIILCLLLFMGSWWKSQKRHYVDRIRLLIPSRNVENRDNRAKETDSSVFFVVIILLFLLFLLGKNPTSKTADNQTTPTFAKSLFFFLASWEREMLIGDLEEERDEILKKFGKRQAEIWYWQQVATSFWPLLIATIKRIVMRSIRRWIS